MLEHKMPAPMRWVLAAIVVFILLLTVPTALNLARQMASDDILLEVLIPALVFELAMAGCLIWIAWSGTLRHIHGFFMAGAVGVWALCIAGFLADLMPMVPAADRHIGFIAIMVVIVGWLPMVIVINSHYHAMTREKLLEIQYQLAELADQIKKLE